MIQTQRERCFNMFLDGPAGHIQVPIGPEVVVICKCNRLVFYLGSALPHLLFVEHRSKYQKPRIHCRQLTIRVNKTKKKQQGTHRLY